jgi:hypothetical protein
MDKHHHRLLVGSSKKTGVLKLIWMMEIFSEVAYKDNYLLSFVASLNSSGFNATVSPFILISLTHIQGIFCILKIEICSFLCRNYHKLSKFMLI